MIGTEIFKVQNVVYAENVLDPKRYENIGKVVLSGATAIPDKFNTCKKMNGEYIYLGEIFLDSTIQKKQKKCQKKASGKRKG